MNSRALFEPRTVPSTFLLHRLCSMGQATVPIVLFLTIFFFCGRATIIPKSQVLVLSPLPKSRTRSHLSQPIFLSSGESSAADSVVIPLQHIDSLPVNGTPLEIFHLRLKRDADRVKKLNSQVSYATSASSGSRGATRMRKDAVKANVTSGISLHSGEYFARIAIGTPPMELYFVLDTGSDLPWLQCAPCKNCYSQVDPIFHPRKSSSFVSVSCDSSYCKDVHNPACGEDNECLYELSYGDKSFTSGYILTETLRFGWVPVNVTLGCGQDNEGLFAGAGGLLGLGRGKLSFPSQTAPRFHRKFSYCLVDSISSQTDAYSVIVFGDAAVPRNAMFTPLLYNPRMDTFYYVELLGISVGGSRVASITPSLFKLDPSGYGGVIIDSGTSVTRLTKSAYVEFRDAFLRATTDLNRTYGFSLFDTCFNVSGLTMIKVPTVTLHFNGANVTLPAENYVIPVDPHASTVCLAFASTDTKLSIIGNIQQQGFRVVYDQASSRIGFKARACSSTS